MRADKVEQVVDAGWVRVAWLVQKEPELLFLKLVLDGVPFTGDFLLAQGDVTDSLLGEIVAIEQHCFDQLSVGQGNLSDVQSGKYLDWVLVHRFVPNEADIVGLVTVILIPIAADKGLQELGVKILIFT